MKKAKQEAASSRKDQKSLTLAEYGYEVINEQFNRLAKQGKSVLEDTDPEPLHQMRVASRRLRTALQVFDRALKLPKAASATQLRDLARVLGNVRDLDVQIASLKDHYQPQLGSSEQKQLDKTIASLRQQRVKAFARMKATLKGDRYEALKQAYEKWLSEPKYGAIAALPLVNVLPDLLTPLLSHLLLHPGWLISAQEGFEQSGIVLHDLRKECKHVRYEGEFFTSFYGKDFQNWIKVIKNLQDRLGEFQDTQVLLELLADEVGDVHHLPDLQTAIHQRQSEALAEWDSLRQQYLKFDFRYQLHRMLLQPTQMRSLHSEETQPTEATDTFVRN